MPGPDSDAVQHPAATPELPPRRWKSLNSIAQPANSSAAVHGLCRDCAGPIVAPGRNLVPRAQNRLHPRRSGLHAQEPAPWMPPIVRMSEASRNIAGIAAAQGMLLSNEHDDNGP